MNPSQDNKIVSRENWDFIGISMRESTESLTKNPSIHLPWTNAMNYTMVSICNVKGFAANPITKRSKVENSSKFTGGKYVYYILPYRRIWRGSV